MCEVPGLCWRRGLAWVGCGFSWVDLGGWTEQEGKDGVGFQKYKFKARQSLEADVRHRHNLTPGWAFSARCPRAETTRSPAPALWVWLWRSQTPTSHQGMEGSQS